MVSLLLDKKFAIVLFPELLGPIRAIFKVNYLFDDIFKFKIFKN